jgi:hypothetical protein
MDHTFLALTGTPRTFSPPPYFETFAFLVNPAYKRTPTHLVRSFI